MATENVNITRPVEIRSDCNSRVALDLMDMISRHESVSSADQEKREYWLTLYAQCLKAASGNSVRSILENN